MNKLPAKSTRPFTAKLFQAFLRLRQNFETAFARLPRAARYGILSLIALGLAASGFLLLFPSSYGSYVRLPVNLQTLGPEDFPQGTAMRFPEADPDAPARRAMPLPFEGGARVSGEALLDGPESGHYGFTEFAPPSRERGLVNFTHGLVSIATTDSAIPLALLRHSPIPNMPLPPDIFQADMFTPADYSEGDIPPLLYGEEMDENGQPSRWGRPENSLPDLMACGLSGGRGSELFRLLRASRFLPGTSFSGQSGRYRAVARRYAQMYGQALSLVLAIIQTESNFNPYAVSRSQAVGLMQIVPETAGHEVYRYLTGLPGQPAPEVLFSPEHNIRYGVIYLHLLGRRYFGNVTHPRSRQMCIIAAYNGGPNAVLRLFDSDQDAAIARINTLTPEEVYKALTSDMPSAETRRYVELVLSRMQAYSPL